MKIKQVIKNNQGVSLLELIVAIAIFIAMMLLVTGIFKSVVEGQRSAIAAQNTQESMRYAFEVMSKEIRNAKGTYGGSACDSSPVGVPTYKVYNTSETGGADSGDELYFENKKGECVAYYIENDGGINRLKIWRDTEEFFITPDEIEIASLEFTVTDDEKDTFHSVQPRVTITMEVEMAGGKAMHKQPMVMQTTISSRFYQ